MSVFETAVSPGRGGSKAAAMRSPEQARVAAGWMTPLDWQRVDELAAAYRRNPVMGPPVHSPPAATTPLPSPAARILYRANSPQTQHYANRPKSHGGQPLPAHLLGSDGRVLGEPGRGGVFPEDFERQKAAKERARRVEPVRQALQAQRWGVDGAPPRLVGVDERERAFRMFDLDNKGRVWAFELETVMQAAGYKLSGQHAEVVLGAFGMEKGASLTLTEFHALCDYHESVVHFNNALPKGPKQRQERMPGQYAEFPGYNASQPQRYRPPAPTAFSSTSQDVDLEDVSEFTRSQLPRRPTHLGDSLDSRQAAFMMFDLDGSDHVSVIDLPQAFAAAGFKKVKFRPHVTGLLDRFAAGSSQVSFQQFQQMCQHLENTAKQ